MNCRSGTNPYRTGAHLYTFSVCNVRCDNQMYDSSQLPLGKSLERVKHQQPATERHAPRLLAR